MLEEGLLGLHRSLSARRIVLCFIGHVSQQVTDRLVATMVEEVAPQVETLGLFHQSLSIFVEMLQNISRYGQADPEMLSPASDHKIPAGNYGIVVVGFENGRLFVQAGNFVESTREQSLIENLETLKAMDGEQLREHYRQRRRASPPAHSKGAGLGLIEIARHASRMDYRLEPVDQTYSFFTLSIAL